MLRALDLVLWQSTIGCFGIWLSGISGDVRTEGESARVRGGVLGEVKAKVKGEIATRKNREAVSRSGRS